MLNPPVGSTEFTWTPDIRSETALVFTMVDSKGRMGGTTQVYTVGVNPAGDSSCLVGHIPQTLQVHPTETTTGATETNTASASTTQSPTSSPTSGASGSSGVSGGAIAGAIIGTLLAIAVAASLLWFFWWRRRGSTSAYGGTGALPYRSRKRDNLDLMPETSEGAASAINPYPFYGVASTTPGGAPSSSNLLQENDQLDGQSYVMADAHTQPSASRPESGAPSGSSMLDRTISSPTRRKAAMAGLTTFKQPRFILHTDAEDENVPPHEDEVVELPPQYTERRMDGRPSTIAEETSSGYSMPGPSSSASTPSRAGGPLPATSTPPSLLPSIQAGVPLGEGMSASVLDGEDVSASNLLQQPIQPTPTPSPTYGKSFLP